MKNSIDLICAANKCTLDWTEYVYDKIVNVCHRRSQQKGPQTPNVRVTKM